MRTFKTKSRLWTVVCLLLLACLLVASPAIAADGTGDGSGGGTNVPLALATSVPAAGQTDVPVSQVIKLTFNKNVINLTVRDINKNCFSLSTASGSKVAIQVIMADDQLYPEEKRNISIKPSQPLQPGTNYMLTISAGLQAKNGTSLGQATTVKFTTAGTAVNPNPVVSQPSTGSQTPPGNITTPANNTVPNNSVVSAPATVDANAAPAEIKNTEVATNPASADKPEAGANQNTTAAAPAESPTNKTYAIGAGLVLIVAAGYLYSKKKTKK